MLKLMYDGREFRLSDGMKVDLADANICVDDVGYSFGEIRVEARAYGEIKRFNTEFEFELWRNSLKSSGFYTVNNNRIELLLKGEKVQTRITNIGSSMPDTISVTSLRSPVVRHIPTSVPTLEVEFTVPMYKENQCI